MAVSSSDFQKKLSESDNIDRPTVTYTFKATTIQIRLWIECVFSRYIYVLIDIFCESVKQQADICNYLDDSGLMVNLSDSP